MKSLYTTVIVACMIGCSEQSQVTSTEPPVGIARKLQPLPVAVKVKQRSTQTVSHSENELMLTVDDVTRGQVMVSLVDKDGAPLFGPVSMKKNDSKRFQIDNVTYAIRLDELDNALVGDDFASFVIDVASSGSLTEEEKIEKLIAGSEGGEPNKFHACSCYFL